jgi:gamma-glutamyltranspeptidase/glutathione hydrolase
VNGNAITSLPLRRGIVVSAHPAATDAGRDALVAGGNAVDAAVAAAWALCVCEPSGSGLGGQTVLLIRRGGRTVAIDGHSRAPARAARATITTAQQRRGHRATTVPTTPATLEHVQAQYGSLPAARLLAPAIRLAEEGYEISPLQQRQLRWCMALLGANPAASRFLNRGRPYRPGELFVQPQLGACLRRLATHGAEDFYRGDIARAIERDMRRHDGLLNGGDLASVGPPREREPIAISYRGHRTITLPAPGGGPQLLYALAELERRRGKEWQEDPDAWYQAIAGAVQSAFRSRQRSHRLAEVIISRPVLAGAGAASQDDGETTHLCTADSEGTVVALTQSIQSLFGAKAANPDYGFLYNNYLLTCPRRAHKHRLGPGVPARSNAAPTIVLREPGNAGLHAFGAAGSRRIISSLATVISGVLDLSLSLSDAVERPRVHPRLRSGAWLERPAASPELIRALRNAYGAIELRHALSYSMGAVQALEISENGEMFGAADPRREGTAARC